jgi:broad specificity phosphatase PhoE
MGREVILVSHQLPIWITRLAYESKRFVHNPRSRQCALASLTSFTFDGGALTGIEYRTPAAELVPVHGAKGRAR